VNDALLGWLMAPDAPDETLTLEDFLKRPEWHQRAACRGVGVDQFIVGRGGGQYDAARELCAVCPVRTECLETALADPELQGMWGATSEVQRKAMRRASGDVPARRASTMVVRTRRRRDVPEREVELRWTEGEIVDDEGELDRREAVGRGGG